MSLPPNFPLTQQEIDLIDSRLSGVGQYAGVGMAGSLRDLKKVRSGMEWLLNRFEKARADRSVSDTQVNALKAYLTQTEAVLASYAAGNWDTGTAARQLINNLPQIP